MVAFPEFSHSGFLTDLSWNGQFLTLWQQWRREVEGKRGLEGMRRQGHKVLGGSTAHLLTIRAPNNHHICYPFGPKATHMCETTTYF